MSTWLLRDCPFPRSAYLLANVVYVLSMAIPAQRCELSVIYFAPSIVFRIIPLAYVALVLLGAGYISLAAGLKGIRNQPALWWLAIIGAVSAAWMLRLAFPPRRTQARLEIRHDRVSFVPRRIDQYLSGEQVTEAAITPQSSELLLCHGFLEDMHVGYGVIVRDLREREQEVRLTFFKQPDAQDCHAIAEDLTAATGLPVRLVIRRSTNGTVDETPWIPIAPKERRARGFALLTYAALPYAGGLTAGFLRLRLAIIVVVGLVLWIAQMLTVIAYARWQRMPNEPQLLFRSVVSLFTFGSAYGLAAIFGAFIFRAH